MKIFETPEIEVTKFMVADILTTSGETESGGDDWSGGEF